VELNYFQRCRESCGATRREKVLEAVSNFRRRILLLAGCAVVAYFFVPALLLRFALDRFVFPLVDSGVTHEDRVIDVPLGADRSIRIREYGGRELPHCVIFFPGQHGGISTYEQTLFPNIETLGITVYALSYPGQDGARGRSYGAGLIQNVDTALATINHETSCQPGNAVFVGRSLGSVVALLAAQRVRPKGLLLDGVPSTLTTAIKAALRRHIATRPWTLLPVQSLVKNDFQLLPVIHALRPIPIVIFQGMEDQVTPFAETQSTVVGQDNVQFFAIPGATHTHAYLLSMPQYSKKLQELVGP
jgi:Alpha/beta hydrolase family